MPMWTALDTVWWHNVVFAISSNFHTSGRIQGCSAVCRWDESLSQLIYVYSFLMLTVLVTALVGADVDCARYVVVAQCGACC
jgi:hypothetical protein